MSSAQLGIGERQFWGFSPGQAAELLQSPSSADSSSTSDTSPTNLLLLGSNDVRHIIYTLFQQTNQTKNHNNSTKPLHFYLNENCLEILARQIILLYIFLDASLEKAHFHQIFLEIYANTTISKRSNEYLQRVAEKITKWIVNYDAGRSKIEEADLLANSWSLSDIFSLKHLKHKERDFLENIFKKMAFDAKQTLDAEDPSDTSSWKSFDVNQMRDIQLRQIYKDRYDSRDNLFDWDYHMKLAKLKGASIIHLKEYDNFRKNGICYQFTEDNNYPNWTLRANALKRAPNGRSVVVSGFFGDLMCGPFQNFGLYTSNKDLYHKNSDGSHQFPSLYLAQHNLTEYREAIFNQSKQLDFRVHFLMTNLESLSGRSAFKSFFHAAFVGCMFTQWIGMDGFAKILSPHARIACETVKFLIPLSNAQRAEFYKQMLQMASKGGLKQIENEAEDSLEKQNEEKKPAKRSTRKPLPEETEPGLLKNVIVFEYE